MQEQHKSKKQTSQFKSTGTFFSAAPQRKNVPVQGKFNGTPAKSQGELGKALIQKKESEESGKEALSGDGGLVQAKMRGTGDDSTKNNATPTQLMTLSKPQGPSVVHDGSPVQMQKKRKAMSKTEIKHTPASITWEGATGIVGKEMEAKLNPEDVVTGSATNPNNMTDIDHKVAEYNKGNYARGHLLNHDLGGYAVPENLYPITSGANAHHAQAVEYPVKKALMEAKANKGSGNNPDKQGIYYKVLVKGTPDHSQFHCEWSFTDENYNQIGQKNKTIVDSKLNGASGTYDVDPYFSARGGIKGDKMGDWYHGQRSGAEDIANEDVQERIKIEANNAVPEIDESEIPSDRALTDEQKQEIKDSSAKSKLVRLYENSLETIKKELRFVVRMKLAQEKNDWNKLKEKSNETQNGEGKGIKRKRRNSIRVVMNDLSEEEVTTELESLYAKVKEKFDVVYNEQMEMLENKNTDFEKASNELKEKASELVVDEGGVLTVTKKLKNRK